MAKKSGFKAKTKVWINKDGVCKLIPCVTVADRVSLELALVVGWSRGMGSRGKLNRPPQKQVINTITQETKWIPKNQVKEFLILNPLWSLGSGKSYNRNNKGNQRGNYGKRTQIGLSYLTVDPIGIAPGWIVSPFYPFSE